MAKLKKSTKEILRQAGKKKGLSPSVRGKFAKKIQTRRRLHPGLFGKK